ncbi:hypothetical protein Goshw_026120 [Gossypium schwendimanii]|uniref:Uncharacterized protein n=1 Tax=Gossypium schwendimanii TaxID=34291 RepID=A0A7J9MQ24_GOSSC|nr:hypothetical protein [Gossypium schwendimanii]
MQVILKTQNYSKINLMKKKLQQIRMKTKVSTYNSDEEIEIPELMDTESIDIDKDS